MSTQNEGSAKTQLQLRQEAACAALKDLCANGPKPLPDEKIIVTPIEDMVERNGRRHKAVNVRWNLSRRLTTSDVMILSYYRGNGIIADKDGYVFGFEGREIDYKDYCKSAGMAYEK
jgi:hypothetical protein